MKTNIDYTDKLAHDISNILQAILMSTEICLADVSNKDTIQLKLKNIKGEVMRAAELIGKIRKAMSEG